MKAHNVALTNGQPDYDGPLDIPLVQRTKPLYPTLRVTDTCAATNVCHVERHELSEGGQHSQVERNQKKDGEQMGVVDKPEGEAKEHKKGNLEIDSVGAVEGSFISMGKVAHECQLETEVGCNGLGVSIDTPTANKPMCGNSPQKIDFTPNNFKFYSRTRWHQRQISEGCLKEKKFPSTHNNNKWQRMIKELL